MCGNYLNCGWETREWGGGGGGGGEEKGKSELERGGWMQNLIHMVGD